jgi:hypothetical protein
MSTAYEEMTGFETDLLDRRSGQPLGGGNAMRLVERVGGKEILYQNHEPDAGTAREDYWYHTRLNALFKRIVTTNPVTGKTKAIWKMVSEH